MQGIAKRYIKAFKKGFPNLGYFLIVVFIFLIISIIGGKGYYVPPIEYRLKFLVFVLIFGLILWTIAAFEDKVNGLLILFVVAIVAIFAFFFYISCQGETLLLLPQAICLGITRYE